MPWKRDHSRRLLGFAREMRTEATDAERRLWRIVRSRRLARFKFRRQHPVAGYVVDFVCMSAGLVVELDGGQHLDPAAKDYDARRTRRLARFGFRVMRVPDDRMLKYPDAIAEAIYRELTRVEPSVPTIPSPGIPGAG